MYHKNLYTTCIKIYMFKNIYFAKRMFDCYNKYLIIYCVSNSCIYSWMCVWGGERAEGVFNVIRKVQLYPQTNNCVAMIDLKILFDYFAVNHLSLFCGVLSWSFHFRSSNTSIPFSSITTVNNIYISILHIYSADSTCWRERCFLDFQTFNRSSVFQWK